jgi:hypothetical protein
MVIECTLASLIEARKSMWPKTDVFFITFKMLSLKLNYGHSTDNHTGAK